jgi:fructokinase
VTHSESTRHIAENKEFSFINDNIGRLPGLGRLQISMAGAIVGLGELLWDMLPSGPRAGGAPFNFAFHCHQLGHRAVIVSRVGDDELGHSLRAEVRRLGMSDEFIQIDPAHATGTVRVTVDAGGQPSYTIAENVAWDYLEWRDEFGSLIQSTPAVCFGTLAQRHPVSRATIHRLLASCGKDAIRLCDVNLRPPFVDGKIITDSIQPASWLKMNEEESERMPGPSTPDQRRKLTCITRGGNGCAVTAGVQQVDVPGIPVQVADTVGAGDAFSAGLLTQMLEGKSLERAAMFANALAALVASRPGGTPRIERAEVERMC